LIVISLGFNKLKNRISDHALDTSEVALATLRCNNLQLLTQKGSTQVIRIVELTSKALNLRADDVTITIEVSTKESTLLL
jgi:hypothetical protein